MPAPPGENRDGVQAEQAAGVWKRPAAGPELFLPVWWTLRLSAEPGASVPPVFQLSWRPAVELFSEQPLSGKPLASLPGGPAWAGAQTPWWRAPPTAPRTPPLLRTGLTPSLLPAVRDSQAEPPGLPPLLQAPEGRLRWLRRAGAAVRTAWAVGTATAVRGVSRSSSARISSIVRSKLTEVPCFSSGDMNSPP